jgi:hypothetical protein
MTSIEKNIVVVIVVLSLCVGLSIFFCNKALHEVSKHGLKNVTNQIWNGPDTTKH